MALAYKQPQNYRSAPVRVGTPEGITISGGLALLAEAPSDPANPATPMTVVVNGGARTRVAGTPASGQYCVRSQTVITSGGSSRAEHLPVLEFHASDEGLSGTVDYYAVGSVLTSEWVDALAYLLTPITGVADTAALQALAPPSASLYAAGRPGRIAFLTDHSMYFSDGSTWIQVAANMNPNAWSEAMGLTPRFGVTQSASFAAAWTALNTVAKVLGFSSASTYVSSGVAAMEGLGLGLGLGSASSFTAAWTDARAQALAMGASWASAYSAAASGVTIEQFLGTESADAGVDPVTSSATLSWASGDVIVVVFAGTGTSNTPTGNPIGTGGACTVGGNAATLRNNARHYTTAMAYTPVWIWTYAATGAATGQAVSIDLTGAQSGYMGVYVCRGASGTIVPNANTTPNQLNTSCSTTRHSTDGGATPAQDLVVAVSSANSNRPTAGSIIIGGTGSYPVWGSGSAHGAVRSGVTGTTVDGQYGISNWNGRATSFHKTAQCDGSTDYTVGTTSTDTTCYGNTAVIEVRAP